MIDIEFIQKYYTPQKLISEGSHLATYWEYKPSLINPFGKQYLNKDIVTIISIIAILKCNEVIYDNEGLDIFQIGIFFKDISIEEYIKLMEELKIIFHTINSKRLFLSNKIYHIKYH